jgi:hypothetical protein
MYKIYKDTRDSFSNRAVQLEISARTIFNNSVAAQPIPTSADGITAYDAQFGTTRSAQEIQITQAGKYRLEAKKFDYLFRTQGKLNHIFQKSGFIKNSVDAQLFYENDASNTSAKFLNNTLLSFGTDASTISIYNELFADYFGPIRLGVGVLLNNQSLSDQSVKQDTAKMQQNAIQTLIGGGGNGTVNISLPLFSYVTNDNKFYVKMLFNPQTGVNVPKIGTSTSSPAYNWDIGIGGSVYYTGSNGAITFFSNYRFSYLGGSPEFYQGLNKPDNKAFFFNQISIGMAITSSVRFSWNTYYGDPFVNKTFPHSFSVSIIPN